MRERFVYDDQRDILFIDFSGLRIERREQVDESATLVRDAYNAHGGRLYAAVNYEGTEIAPEMVEYYGERIKELQDRYAMTTVRYASSGFTRSMLRYLGAATDLESNTFGTREEAIHMIDEIRRRSAADDRAAIWRRLLPRESALGKLVAGWTACLAALALVTLVVPGWQAVVPPAAAAALALVAGAVVAGAIQYVAVVRPLGRMERGVHRFVAGVYEPVALSSHDEVGRLGAALEEAARQLRRDMERLNGLYHISLMLGTGTEMGRICELVTRKVARLLDAEMCVILLAGERDRTISAQAPAYGVRDEHLRLLEASLDERTVATWVFATGEAHMTNDASTDPLVDPAMAALLGVRAVLAVPLRAGDRTLGTLEVMNKRDGEFLEEEKRLVTVFASQVAHLLSNAQLLGLQSRLTEQLIVSERLAAVGELVAGVAHEVRNPLCGITTTLNALARRLEDREGVEPFLDVVRTETARLNYLMEQLLEHSRPLRLEADEADIRAVIHESVEEFAHLALEKGIDVSVESPAPLPRLRFDRRKMHGVFANLVSNALQHTAPGGRIEIVVQSSAAAPDDRRLYIEFRDTGAGIAPEHLGRIFDPFFTTRTAGTGLGLAIVRKTIHDHGGTITVRSQPGRQTVFAIDLPLQVEPSRQYASCLPS